jgi:hypothetical protein
MLPVATPPNAIAYSAAGTVHMLLLSPLGNYNFQIEIGFEYNLNRFNILYCIEIIFVSFGQD